MGVVLASLTVGTIAFHLQLVTYNTIPACSLLIVSISVQRWVADTSAFYSFSSLLIFGLIGPS